MISEIWIVLPSLSVNTSPILRKESIVRGHIYWMESNQHIAYCENCLGECIKFLCG